MDGKYIITKIVYTLNLGLQKIQVVVFLAMFWYRTATAICRHATLPEKLKN